MSNKLGTIEKLMDGYNPVRQRMEETKGLVKKWEATGLLEGLQDEQKTHGMAVLLENQARQLIDEASQAGTNSDSEQWSGVALPLVRKIFGELAAQEFVSVQPMNLPSGLIFYLDFKYGSAQAGFTSGNDVFGITSGSGDPTAGLYGAGRFAYSANDNASSAQSKGTSVSDGTYTTGSVTFSDVDFEPDLSASVSTGADADNGLMKINVATAALSGYDPEGIRAFNISGSNFDEFFPAHTKLNAAETEISFIVKKDRAQTLVGNVVVDYHKQPTDATRGDFEATASGTGAESDAGIPEIDIQMRSIPIVAKTRKLKAVWTPELAQDLNAYHSVDAEAELTALLSEYVSMEIDLEILDMLRTNASAKTENYSAKVGFEFNSATNLFEETSANSNAYTKGEWFQTLGNKIQSVSNAIHQKTLRGGANFIVVSPETATILESIPGYATSSDGDASANQYAMGVQKAGLLNNRYTVYKNPYQFENVILVGFRGSNFLETGAVYAPYVPMIMTPLVYDPTNFTPRKGVMTRYAKKMVRSEFYGLVRIADIDKV
tara:strand:- start:15352 stop:16995 length:1644 start_codon:yes stop_codon:yes gene_type:complete